MKTYVPESERIVHSTSIDFKKRSVIKPIHIVQYDNSLPIIAVSMFSDGFAYTLPEGADANVRFKKPDGKVVYNPVLGCDKTTVRIILVRHYPRGKALCFVRLR